MKDTAFRYGMRLAAAAANHNIDDLDTQIGFDEGVKSAADQGVCPADQDLAMVIDHIFKTAEARDMIGYYLFEKMATSKTWSREFSGLMDAAFVGMARYEDMVKASGAMPAAALFNTTQKTLTQAPGALAKMLQLATPIGILGGTGMYLASRDVKEDSAANEMKKVRAQEYRRLAQQIENELQSRSGAGEADTVRDIASKYVHAEV